MSFTESALGNINTNCNCSWIFSTECFTNDVRFTFKSPHSWNRSTANV